MKMRKTKIKFMSLLLAVMMIVGMLPTTAFAASYAKISVNGILLRDAAYLADNSSTSATTGANNEPSSYVAWYKNGVLTLKDYNGKGIET